MKNKNGYIKIMTELWDIKNEINGEIKDLNYSDLQDYINKNTVKLKQKLNKPCVNLIKH